MNREENMDKVLPFVLPEMTLPVAQNKKKQVLQDAITAYVDNNLTRKITLRAVSEHCGVSISTVTQLFQKQGTMTFHQYLTLRRMDAARKLIMGGVSLEEAGKQVGYGDHSSFYRAFRQTFGVSPRAFRKAMEK